MSIGPPMTGIELFQNLTMKIQGQGQGRGQSWKSQHGYNNVQSTHISFVPCLSGIPFLSYDFFKSWPWKSRVKVMGEVTVQSHNVSLNILSTHIPFVPCQLALPCLRYSIFKIWPRKARVKVKWPRYCTTTGLDNSIELWMVSIYPAVSEIWVPQSLAQVLPDLTSFFGPWVSPYGANDYDVAQLQV